MRATRRILGLLALCAGLCLPFASGARAEDATPEPATDSVHQPATIMLWNRPVAQLRATFAGMTPQARSERAVLRVGMLPLIDTTFTVDATATTIAGQSGYIIRADGQIIFGLLPEDLDPESPQTLEQAASQAAVQLSMVLKAHIMATRPELLWSGTLRSGVATLIFLLLMWLLWRLRGYFLRRLGAAVHKRGARLLNMDVGPFMARAEAGLVKLALLAAFAVAGYVWLYYVLSQFYFSQPWADRMGGYLTGLATSMGLGILHAMPDLFTVLAIFLVTRLFVQIMGSFFRAIEAGQLEVRWVQQESARITRKIFSAVVWLFALTIAYPYIPGSETDAFKGVSVFAGLMISLGSTGLINQLVSGIVVVYSRALKTGDIVRVGETVGQVSEVGFLSTKIMSPRLEHVTIPNAVMIGNTVTNYSALAQAEGAMATTSVTIGYDAPWRQVHAMLLQAAAQTSGIRRQPEPFVVQKSLGDFYVEYELRFRLERAEERFQVTSRLHGEIQDAFNSAGVQIMSPHFEGQPSDPIVVPKTKWFAPPASGTSSGSA